jgi:hypothetical protein
VLIVAVGSTIPFLLAKANLAAAIKELKREGMPVTFQEFADKYYKPVPEGQNAAEVFDAAYPLIDNKIAGDRLVFMGLAASPRYDQEIAPVLLAPAEEYVRKNRDFFNEMDKIRKFDRIHFNYEWEKGVEILQPQLIYLRNILKIYAVKTEPVIKQNDRKQAEGLLKTMFHISRLSAKSPFIIGQLVFYVCEASCVDRLERCMNTLNFTAEQLKSFEKICSEHEEYVIKQYPYSWKSELTFLLSILQSDISDIIENNIYLSPYNSNPYFKDLPEKYRLAYYYYSGSLMSDLVSATKIYKKIMAVPVDIYAIRKTELEKVIDENKVHIDNIDISTTITDSYAKTIRTIAHLRCAKTACAVERFRLKYGKLPEKLEQLVPEFMVKIPIDPFDGKKLRYVRGSFDVQYEVPDPPVEPKKKKAPKAKELKYKTVTAKKAGFCVYSIGSDLKDDKAENLWERRFKDIIFVVLDKEKVKTNGQKKH